MIVTLQTRILCSLFALLCIVLSRLKALPIKSCTDDQYKRISPNGSFVCVDCLKCPHGLGPSVECGSTITADTRIHCKKCIAGVDFSPFNDYEQCQSCSVCSEDQVSKPCTPTHDTICEKRCISKGKYYEKSSDDCQDCTQCCGDGNDEVIDECLKKGMPAQKSCTVHRKRSCKPPPTTAIPSTALPTSTNPLATMTIQSTAKETTAKETTAKETTAKETTDNNSSDGKTGATTIEMEVFIGVCLGLGSLFIIAVLVWLLTTYHKKCGICTGFSQESPKEFQVIYTRVLKEEELDSIIATFAESKLFELFEKNPNLKEVVCNKLDLKKSYAKLARRVSCKVDEDKVRKLEENPGHQPTCEIFDCIQGARPDFLFCEFAHILKDIQRLDVLQWCVEQLQPLKEITEVVSS